MAIQDLFTPEQLAAKLQLEKETLNDWRWKKKGPKYIKFGSRVRYKASDVAEWMDSLEVSGGAG